MSVNHDQAFLDFHREHPEVYGTLVRLAREAKSKGRQRGGVGMLWEVMRWTFWMQTADPSGFKLNNNHRSRYARLIMQRERDLAGFFEVRELRS